MMKQNDGDDVIYLISCGSNYAYDQFFDVSNILILYFLMLRCLISQLSNFSHTKKFQILKCKTCTHHLNIKS